VLLLEAVASLFETDASLFEVIVLVLMLKAELLGAVKSTIVT